MIIVLVLTFNRPEAVRSSMIALKTSLENSCELYEIHLFDDGSESSNYNDIRKTCANLFNQDCITFHRSHTNKGYNANLIKAIMFGNTLIHDENNIFYIHESDMIVSKNWIKKLTSLLIEQPNLIVTPVHLVDHLFPEHQRKLINNEIEIQNLYLCKQDLRSIFTYNKCKVYKCYGTIGTLAFKQNFLIRLVKQIGVLSKLKGGEDAFISYLASGDLVYIFPGQSRIHASEGLHGNMSLSVASFEKLKIFSLLLIFIKKLINLRLRPQLVLLFKKLYKTYSIYLRK